MTAKTSTVVSFVIPALNEEDGIAETLTSIKSGELVFAFEIIVVDHDSNDKTVEIALSLGAKVVHAKGGTIADVRNIGVNCSNGALIVFLDADVSLTQKWFDAFGQVVEQLNTDPMIVTGSHCNPPLLGSWIERYWFNNLTHEIKTSHLGTGHMIVSRDLFDRVDGFDGTLETGEDYEFCSRVVRAGGRIINNPDLYVIHRHYPKDIIAFILREAWHGMGDVGSVTVMLKSKVVIASLLFIVFHIMAALVVFLPVESKILSALPLVSLGGLLLFSAWRKFNHSSIKVILINSVIFYLYFLGRSLSLFRGLFSMR